MSTVVLKHLEAWNQACTIERCDPETAEALAAYARNRTTHYLNVAGASIQNPDLRTIANQLAVLSGRESVCWALLEFRLNTGVHREGKHYKSWLFDYGDGKTDTEQRRSSLLSGIDLMIQVVVRDYCAGSIRQNERDQNFSVLSLDAVNQDGDSLADYYLAQAERLLVPSPDQEVARRGLEEKAAQWARELIHELDDRWKVLLLVKYTEQSKPDGRIISLDHPALFQAAGCSKSQLYAARRDFSEFLSGKIHALIGAGDPETTAQLKVMVATALIDLLFSWAESEKRCSALLTYLKEKKGYHHERV